LVTSLGQTAPNAHPCGATCPAEVVPAEEVPAEEVPAEEVPAEVVRMAAAAMDALKKMA
jgi:hypothetical protein